MFVRKREDVPFTNRDVVKIGIVEEQYLTAKDCAVTAAFALCFALFSLRQYTKSAGENAELISTFTPSEGTGYLLRKGLL